jgi:hypothetical protein
VAVLGMMGICSCVAAIDWICWPSGRLTVMFGVSTSLVVGSWSVVRKWPVLPVSAMVWTYVGDLVVGGPKGVFEDKILVVNNALLWVVSCSTSFLGSPPRQLGGTVGAFRGTGTYTWTSPRFRWMRLFPPNILVMVASCRCPGLGPLHD